MEKTELVLCDCGSPEHQLILTWGSTDEDFDFLYVHVHLSSWKGFFGRVWDALKFTFGYRCRYGEWDEIIINRAEAERVRAFIDDYLGD